VKFLPGLTAGDEPSDGSCGAIYDSNDELHVAWGSYFYDGSGAAYLSREVGIRHWSKASDVQEIALPLQDTTICFPPGRDGNYATAPDIAVDSGGGVYIIFSQMTAERDVNDNCHEHVYAVASSDNGFTWTEETDITPGTGFDASFPSLADFVNDNPEGVASGVYIARLQADGFVEFRKLLLMK
jgi:hypothetical protein